MPRTSFLARHLAALRALVALTLLLGVGYPLAVTAVAHLPFLASRADGSLVRAGGRVVGSALIGQSFTDARGRPLPQYLQSRPSAAGAAGYDPTASGASNLGPQDVVDGATRPSLLSQVCARSAAVGALEGVSGARPFCTPDGAGAVLAVERAGGLPAGAVRAVVSADQPCPAVPFVRTWHGTSVACRGAGQDLTGWQVVPVRGDAPASPAVPADAVTASGSGLDPQISPAYARLQAPRLARVRGVPARDVLAVIDRHTSTGVLGQAGVDVLAVNLDLDRADPVRR